MDELYGQVRSVEQVRRGVTVTEKLEHSLRVVDATDLNSEGGVLLAPDGTRITYVGVSPAVGEDELAPDDDTVDPGDLVELDQSGDDLTSFDFDGELGGFLAVDPPEVDVIADVEIEGGSIPVMVPHALRPILPLGVREDDAREGVTLRRQGTTGWVVADVLADVARVSAAAVVLDDGSSLPDVLDQATADIATRSRVSVKSVPPTGDDAGAEGDLWWVADGSGAVTGLWSHDGTGWVQRPATGATLADGTILAPKLAAGAVTAAAIAAGAIDGMTITGALIQTEKNATSGVKLTSSGIKGFDAQGVQTVNVDGKNNLLAGEFRTGLTAPYVGLGLYLGFPALVLTQPGSASDGTPGRIFMRPSTSYNVLEIASGPLGYVHLDSGLGTIVDGGLQVGGSIGGSAFNYTDFNPQWSDGTNKLAIGNGVLTARYRRIGTTVDGYIAIQRGSTTNLGGNAPYQWTPPLKPRIPPGASTVPFIHMSGFVVSAQGRFAAVPFFTGDTAGTMSMMWTDQRAYVSGGTANRFTWANGDKIYLGFSYES